MSMPLRRRRPAGGEGETRPAVLPLRGGGSAVPRPRVHD
jgi:hypothetical protein